MAVAETWHDCAVASIDHFLGSADINLISRTNCCDGVARDRDDATIDNRLSRHGQHGSIDDGDVGHTHSLTARAGLMAACSLG